MRSAPPVLVPVGRFVWGHALTLCMAALVALALALTCLASGVIPEQGLMWTALWVLAAFLSWRLAQHEALPAGALAWDGEGWTHHASLGVPAGPAEPVHVRVLWDAGSAMLVAVRSREGAGSTLGQRQRYAWLRAAQMPGPASSHWHAWRCAVYAGDIL